MATQIQGCAYPLPNSHSFVCTESWIRKLEVRLLKEVKLDERQAVKYMDFLQLIRTIRDETEKHQCSHPSCPGYSTAAAVASFVLL